jgi:hypothetical protein
MNARQNSKMLQNFARLSVSLDFVMGTDRAAAQEAEDEMPC